MQQYNQYFGNTVKTVKFEEKKEGSFKRVFECPMLCVAETFIGQNIISTINKNSGSSSEQHRNQ